MTRAEVLVAARDLGFSHIRTVEQGAVTLEDWKPSRTDSYDGYKIVAAEIVVDEPKGRFGGAWPLLVRGKPS